MSTIHGIAIVSMSSVAATSNDGCTTEMLPHPQATLPHPQATLPHPQATLPHPQATLPHPQATLPHPQATLPHPQATLPHPQATQARTPCKRIEKQQSGSIPAL